MPHHIVFRPAERPECEALVNGRWVPAEVRMWVQRDDGAWTADVGYSMTLAENRIGTGAMAVTFPSAARFRSASVSRAAHST